MTGKKRESADPAGLPSIHLEISPYSGHTICTVSIDTRAGGQRVHTRLARWSFSVTRSDLAGHSTDDVLHVIMAMVMHRIESGRTDPGLWTSDGYPNPTAVGPGAPASGATGAVQDPLPGLPADSGTPGGVDTI